MKEIGQGGMGIVWCAEDQRLYSRLVALKFIKIHADQRKNATSRHRFMREAFLSSQLCHPNFATIYEFFEHTSDSQTPTGEWVMVFEYIAGETLAKYIHRERKLDPLTVCHIALQLSHALGHMHGLGLLHRDLKPENIMLTALQEPSQYLHLKLLDLGIAKVLPQDEEQLESTKDRMLKAPLTATGYVCGTPEYMSPEQTRGEPLTIASDIYAVGILIFEMLAGVPPLKCKEWGEFLTKRSVNHIPEVNSYTHYHIPAELNLLLNTCLAYEPDERYRTTAALSKALEGVLFNCYAQILPLSNLHLSPTGRQELSVIAEQRSGSPLELVGSALSAPQQATIPPAELKIEERPALLSSPSKVEVDLDFDVEQAKRASRELEPPKGLEVPERISHVDWGMSAERLSVERASAEHPWVLARFHDAREQYQSADPATRSLTAFAVLTVGLLFASIVFGGRSTHEPREEQARAERALAPQDSTVYASSEVRLTGLDPDQQRRDEEMRRQSAEVLRQQREGLHKLKVKGLWTRLDQSFAEARGVKELNELLKELKDSELSSPELTLLRGDITDLLSLATKVERLKRGTPRDGQIMKLLKRAKYKRLKDHSLYKSWYESHDTSLPPRALDL